MKFKKSQARNNSLHVNGSVQARNDYDPNGDLGVEVNDYDRDAPKHYHQFINACLGTEEVSASFSYSARLTETILLGVIAGRFPNRTLHWDSKKAKFKESEANIYLKESNRNF